MFRRLVAGLMCVLGIVAADGRRRKPRGPPAMDGDQRGTGTTVPAPGPGADGAGDRTARQGTSRDGARRASTPAGRSIARVIDPHTHATEGATIVSAARAMSALMQGTTTEVSLPMAAGHRRGASCCI
ncbi:MAG: hypothetical protein U5K74_12565 [Gemmatimonadaceae bacterium]|nr:hypothetical protein [Gemmatimonadaceae bacterium]